MSPNRLSYRADVIVPCYNEQDALPVNVPKILSKFRSLVLHGTCGLEGFRILLVDDGSQDSTWTMISDFSSSDLEVEGIKLARNYGHQSAMLSGLSQAKADVIVTMDADLQDDIDAVDAMFAAYEGGADLALGVRNDRTSDTFGKRNSANLYYRMLSLLGVNIIENHADFRLMSRRALAALLAHEEVNLFLRGLMPTLGFPVVLIPYARKAREHGESKYTLAKMLHLAADGVTSFSVLPLRLIAALGGCVFLLSTITGLVFLTLRLFMPSDTMPGWASTVLPILFLGGIQILSIGVLGEYIGKIYLEVKRRPRFIIQESTIHE